MSNELTEKELHRAELERVAMPTLADMAVANPLRAAEFGNAVREAIDALLSTAPAQECTCGPNEGCSACLPAGLTD